MYSVNQYKLLYVSRYHYGYINVGSLEVISENQLPSIAETTYKEKGTLFILLKSRQLLKIVGEIIMSEQKLNAELVPENAKISYINSFLFIYSEHSPCFHLLEDTDPILKYPKKICLKKSGGSVDYRYSFYEYQKEVRVLFSQENSTEHYSLLLPFKEED